MTVYSYAATDLQLILTQTPGRFTGMCRFLSFHVCMNYNRLSLEIEEKNTKWVYVWINPRILYTRKKNLKKKKIYSLHTNCYGFYYYFLQ